MDQAYQNILGGSYRGANAFWPTVWPTPQIPFMKPGAICHPDKPRHAKGLCSCCYQAYRRATYQSVRDRIVGSSRKWQKANPERHKRYQSQYSRHYRLKTLYGLDQAGFDRILESQNGRCALCDLPFDDQRRADIDHDHATNRIRGLLCSSCNKGLGTYEKMLRFPKLREYLGYPHE